MLKSYAYAVDGIVQKAKDALDNPAAARAALAQIKDTASLLKSRLSGMGRKWNSPVDVVPDTVVNLDNIPGINASSTSQALIAKFPYAGIVVAMTAGVRPSDTGGAASVGQLDFRVQREGAEDLFTNGDAGTFVNAQNLFFNQNGLMAFPMSRPVRANERWFVTIVNKDAANAHNPVVAFWFKALRD